MSYFSSPFSKIQILNSLRLLLKKRVSVSELYSQINQYFTEKKESFSYSQFNRYIKGSWDIPDSKVDIFMRFLHNELDICEEIIIPSISVNVLTTPIHVDLRRLICYPEKLNLIAFHTITRYNLYRKFDRILTHTEAIPIAIAYSQLLEIPWMNISFQPPPVDRTQIIEHHQIIDQELVGTAYFIQPPKELYLEKKKILIINDYIRRGMLLDTLFRVAEDSGGEIKFLISILGIGNVWKRFHSELEGNMHVMHFV